MAPKWFSDWKHKRQSKALSRTLNRRLEHAGQVHQLLLINVKLHERVIRSICESVQSSSYGQTAGGCLKSLTVQDCFLKDTATVRGLVDLLQRQRGLLERVTLQHNALHATAALTRQHVNALMDALGVVKHLTLGPEFFHDGALQTACERAVTLQLVTDDEQPRPEASDISPSIRLRGLYRGLQSRHCRVQTLILKGSMLDDQRLTLLVDSLLAAPTRAIVLPGRHLHPRSIPCLLRLLQRRPDGHSSLEHFEMDACTLLAAISSEQAAAWGSILAQDTHLQHLILRDVYLTDTLAVPLFTALGKNQVLQELVVTTHFDEAVRRRHRHGYPPVSTAGYQALAHALPALKRLGTLHLGRDFFTSSRVSQDSDFVQTMARAMHANGSIQVYETDDEPSHEHDDAREERTPPRRPRFGPYESMIPYCMDRNRASLVASALCMVAHDVDFGPATWHATILHMAAKHERQTALFQIVQRVLTDSQVSLSTVEDTNIKEDAAAEKSAIFQI